MKPLLAGTVGVATLAALAGTWLAVGSDDDRETAAAVTTSGMVTEFPDLPAPTGEPELPKLRTVSPEPGTVGRIPGPFDSRFVAEDLAFDGRTVRGAIDVTSDVSELLDLQVLAGFYDASGAYLGEGRWNYHLGSAHAHDHAEEHQEFRITVPATIAGRVASAAVGVPVLVNE